MRCWLEWAAVASRAWLDWLPSSRIWRFSRSPWEKATLSVTWRFVRHYTPKTYCTKPQTFISQSPAVFFFNIFLSSSVSTSEYIFLCLYIIQDRIQHLFLWADQEKQQISGKISLTVISTKVYPNVDKNQMIHQPAVKYSFHCFS